MTASTDIAVAQTSEVAEAQYVDTSTTSLVMNSESMNRIYDMANLMANGRATIPKHLQNNQADCAAIVMQSMQWGMNPFAVAQKTHVTQGGTLGYEGQLVNAVIVSKLGQRPEYQFLGDWSKILGRVGERKSEKGGKYYVAEWIKADEDGLGVICSLLLPGESAPRSIQVMLAQAYPRFSTQWATDPQQQICFLAVRKFARRYTPDVILGVYTPEELFEVTPTQRNMGAAEVIPPSDELLAQAREAAMQGVDAYQKFWGGTTKENRKMLAGEHDALKDVAIAVDASRTVENEPTKPAAETDVDPEFLAGLDGKTAETDYTPE